MTVATIPASVYAALTWHTLPEDAGQNVRREYAMHDGLLYCLTTDGNTQELTVAEVDEDGETPFEPWNGLIPDTDGEEACFVGPYSIDLRDEGGADHSVEADDVPDESDCESEAEDWCRGGDWGNDGASVRVYWSVSDALGQDMDLDGSCNVEIEADHESLIAEATRHSDRSCGDSPEDHDWTSEGEGGCDENPGVWATGGTSMSFASHCRTCGLHRQERTTGSQKNPGEHDTVEYEMPDEWCAECESEKCRRPIDDEVVEFSDCDDDEPVGHWVSSHDTEEEAREAASKYAHEKARRGDRVTVCHDDTEDGDDQYHVYCN